MSVALIADGRCRDCEGPLVIVPDGWADCVRCRRRMRIADGVVHERCRVPDGMLGTWVDVGCGIIVVRDDSVDPMIVAASGRGYIPADTRWLQMTWPVPDAA